MIELFGWCCTAIVLLGFILNSRGNSIAALIFWIVGDIGWIIYDIFINNMSHMFLAAAIILINIYGIFYIKKTTYERARMD